MSVALSSWNALGTSVHVVATESDELGPASTAVSEVLEDVDTAYSRFREDSELSRLNASPGRSVHVSPLLATAIDAAQRAARLTDGAVDPTIGHAIRIVGYDDDFSRVAAKAGPVNLRSWRIPGWQAIRFDRRARTVLLPAGVELDLGSTGKALAADLAARAALAAAGAGGVLVSLGGDIAMAGTPPSGGWRIHVAEDSRTNPEGAGEVICLPGGGVATSSTTVRRWTRGTAVLHHIIDPKTSLPATGPFRTVTVAAATCLDANIASTAAIVRGEAAIEWLMSWRLPARLVENDGTIHYIGRWPDPSGMAA
ncbi:MAG: FAD:protein FMN transferase [Candidatus Dormibacteraeota bacterium]|nr:FAD:protein FMN transferase [Candidatus Dormibacteraeota bacterium]